MKEEREHVYISNTPYRNNIELAYCEPRGVGGSNTVSGNGPYAWIKNF